MARSFEGSLRGWPLVFFDLAVFLAVSSREDLREVRVGLQFVKVSVLRGLKVAARVIRHCKGAGDGGDGHASGEYRAGKTLSRPPGGGHANPILV